MAQNDEGSILSGLLWMVFLSILLFWLPLLGPLIAGYVGGRKAGGAGNGLVASLLPSMLIAGFLFFISSLMQLPFLGALLAGGSFILLASTSLPLVSGAIIGGALASSSTRQATVETPESQGSTANSVGSQSSRPVFKCSNCGGTVDQDASYCTHCGVELNVCPDCGEQIDSEATYCSNCGAELSEVSSIKEAKGGDSTDESNGDREVASIEIAGNKHFCGNCGERIKAGSEVCSNCGLALSWEDVTSKSDQISEDDLSERDTASVEISGNKRFCGNCEQEVKVGSEICSNCGRKLLY